MFDKEVRSKLDRFCQDCTEKGLDKYQSIGKFLRVPVSDADTWSTFISLSGNNPERTIAQCFPHELYRQAFLKDIEIGFVHDMSRSEYLCVAASMHKRLANMLARIKSGKGSDSEMETLLSIDLGL